MGHKNLAIIAIIWAASVLYAADCPIIFLHGHDAAADTSARHSWRNPNSAMMKIINEHYGGYKAGVPRDCDEDSTLQDMPDSRRIYNFSYYNPNGNRGVISLNEDSMLVTPIGG